MEPKEVPGCPGLYLSVDGQPFQLIEDRFVLLPVSRSSTYARVSFDSPDGRQRRLVHILMAITFLGLDPSMMGRSSDSLQVDHIDGDKQNNSLDNLQVITKQQNLAKAWQQGAYARNGHASKGKAKPSLRRFTPDDLAEMAGLREKGESYRQIAARFKCDHKAVYRILRGETYQQR